MEEILEKHNEGIFGGNIMKEVFEKVYNEGSIEGNVMNKLSKEI